ncbi:MAG TPA: sigma 54-interacting transcriptional regulator [Magnetospirillaceae bacterium]|nr:sigma 54-interacting transcriptional regulator [Magnetospirillaceae bacterium]
MRRVFLWEEDERERDVLAAILEDEYRVHAIGEADAATAVPRDGERDIIILGFSEGFPEKTMRAIRFLRVHAPATPILCRLPHGDPSLTTVLIRQGAAACISRSCSREELKSWLRDSHAGKFREAAGCMGIRGHRQRLSEPSCLLGESEPMRLVRSRIELYARYDFPVLITGESGTGKELAARSLHRLSARATRCFLALNCGALPETILESELFGTEKGAYTGAVTRQGTFETADGGTLFLDEITELAPGAQAKLLRALENGEVRRLGAREAMICDVRLISATNADMERHQGFRFDLLERLETLVLRMPPLRERLEDIPLLARSFLAHSGLAAEIGDGTLDKLGRHDWPGNIRQLRNTLVRAAVSALECGEQPGLIRPEHVSFGIRPSGTWARTSVPGIFETIQGSRPA